MADEVDVERPWRETLRAVAGAAVPWWFAITGIGLGIGGVVRDEPIAGACGAVAGVTVGWLQSHRALALRRRDAALRRRLAVIRAEAAARIAEQELRIRALHAEVLEQKLMRMLVHPDAETAEELSAEIPSLATPPEPAAGTAEPEKAEPDGKAEPDETPATG